MDLGYSVFRGVGEGGHVGWKGREAGGSWDGGEGRGREGVWMSW